MPRGVPITPAQKRKLAQVFTETGNASEAARRAGIDERVARRHLSPQAERARLYTRARDEGIRRGADAIDKSVTLIDRLLGAENTGRPGMEPRDVAALLRAQASLVAELRALREHTGRTKLARLTRDKTRAEIELLRGKIDGTHVDRVSLEHMTDDDVDARLAALAGFASSDDASATAGDAGAPRGEGAEGEDP